MAPILYDMVPKALLMRFNARAGWRMSSYLMPTEQAMGVQMGGAQGVRRAERYALVNGIAGGLRMHAIPRLAQQKEE